MLDVHYIFLQGFARLQQMEQLKLWFSKMPQTGFKLTTNILEFKPKENSSNQKVITETETENKENNQSAPSAKSAVTHQLMENMAQLWLQQEVQDLEGQESRGKYSPYIVVDQTAIMINHMAFIKDILASKRFLVIVPQAGEKRPPDANNYSKYS